jgi:hypothetical protein
VHNQPLPATAGLRLWTPMDRDFASLNGSASRLNFVLGIMFPRRVALGATDCHPLFRRSYFAY